MSERTVGLVRANGEERTVSDPGHRLQQGLADNAHLIERLEREHRRLLAAAESSTADDEHDPEGATLAWEREQLAATLARAVQTRHELEAALAAVGQGVYGVCAGCGGPIGRERLEALPRTRRCIGCANATRR